VFVSALGATRTPNLPSRVISGGSARVGMWWFVPIYLAIRAGRLDALAHAQTDQRESN